MSELGLLLLVVGAALAVVEAHVPSHGALGAVGVAAGAGGLALVVAGAGSGTAVAVGVALVAALVGAAYLWTVLQQGDPIVVERVDGLTLTVRRAEDWELF